MTPIDAANHPERVSIPSLNLNNETPNFKVG
jgi:hypothetical protein